jgi:AbrB family looped-hinge helix DNA binding protein
MDTALTSRLTSKGQTTIPRPIRERLGLEAGDRVLFLVRESDVVIRKLQGLDTAYLHALEGSLGEWDSPEDDEAYRDL